MDWDLPEMRPLVPKEHLQSNSLCVSFAYLSISVSLALAFRSTSRGVGFAIHAKILALPDAIAKIITILVKNFGQSWTRLLFSSILLLRSKR